MKPTTQICSLAKAVKALTAVALITLCSLKASAQSTVLTKAEYEKITYSWTDDNGVKHDNVPITEKASNPRQIIELLSTVYKDSRVPGPYYNAYDKDGKRERETDYKDLTTNGWNVTGVQKPASEGYTVLIVAVKNTFNDNNTKNIATKAALINYINSSIESVELLTDGMRIGSGENAGTLYNFSGRYNRFFFISKGQARKNFSWEKPTSSIPFFSMFEQFSPTTTDAESQVTDFYAKMSSGEVYPIIHDCSSVTYLEHYFCMNGKNGTTSYDMSGINFFIPDYRLKFSGSTGLFGSDDRSTSISKYVNYHESHQPKTQMYTIKLTAGAAEADTRKYTVTLNWTSNLNSLAGNVEQEYFVYRVINGKVESTPLNTEPIYTTTWSEDVDQLQSGYALTYVVKGRPKGATFNPVQSNEASVSIPGFDPMERLKLNIKGDFESQYNQDSEYNNYSCSLQMNNGVGTSVKKQYLTTGTEFTFLRTTGSESTTVATLKITSTKNSQYGYTLTYANQSKDGSAVSKKDGKGTFTAKSDDDIDFNNFSITDDFCASTATNNHPDKYTYQVRFKPAVAVEGGSGEFVYSNSEDVFVLKTTNTVKDSYTKAQVAADVNRSLSLSESITATFATAATPSIFRYVVRRTQLGSTTEIGQAQQTTEGQYAMSELAKNDKGNYTMTSTGETKSAGSLATVSDNSIIAPSQASYVPVIESYKADKTKAKNTFGCDIKSIHSIDVGIDNAIAMKSASTFQGEDDPSVKYRGFAASFTVMPLRTDDLTSYKFRIWRKINDGSEVLLGGTAPKGSDKWDLPTDYDLINAEEGAAELQSSELAFADNFTAPEGTQKVTYIVRFYAEDADASNYYVSEETIDFDYTKVIPTQVDGVKAAKEVASVKYISTQGRQSSQAFSGVNIVVTTYTDGTTSTEKKLF